MLEYPRVAGLADDLSDAVVIASAERDDLHNVQLSPTARDADQRRSGEADLSLVTGLSQLQRLGNKMLPDRAVLMFLACAYPNAQ